MPKARCSAAWPAHAARLLQGKHKATYTPFIDTGDHVIIINVAKVKLTGRKEEQKIYRRHSGYSGGLREERAKVVRQRQPVRLMEQAVRGMLPKSKLGDAMFRKVKVYAGDHAPASGSATHSVRGRINLGCYSVLRHRAPQGSDRARVPPPGSGTITVNHRTFDNYFPTEALRVQVRCRCAHRDRRAVRRAGDGQRRRRDRPGRRHAPRASRARSARSTPNCGRGSRRTVS